MDFLKHYGSGVYGENSEFQFFRAFLECALWSSTGDDGEPLDKEYSPDDIAPENLDLLYKDCKKFFNDNIELINKTPDGYGYGNAGHDFWLTRNGHGAGFWDGDCEPVGDELTENCKAYPEINLYIGDDKKIYF